MEVCAGFELIAIENAAALGHDVLESGKRREGLVGERLVEDGPKVLGGLKLGRVWGQVDEPEALGHDQVGRSVCQPALSRTSTMMRSRPAPASRANSASSAAKNGLEMRTRRSRPRSAGRRR